METFLYLKIRIQISCPLNLGGGDCEKAGLIKFDFLGLANLTIIDDTIKYIKETQSIEVDLGNINFSDSKSFELLGTGKTRGIFQVESPGMIDTLVKLKPTNLEEVIAVIALYRPGPMELIDSFIKRKKEKKRLSMIILY